MFQARESQEQALQRWHDLELLQEHYRDFGDFLVDVIEDVMGFQCSDIQLDIGDWIANGPQFRMVQAQRGQAKTTITAAYAVWRMIHDPTTRVLIISAGSDMATEVANWVIQIINNMPELALLRPDRAAGDRSSVSAFDIHYSLKGPEKSPSLACLGITSNLQGRRADVLIADDIESQKNAQTATQRARLLQLTLYFTSINSGGDIIWLGTPQNVDSLYNGLPSRGVGIRIWPGRYPTDKELPDYDTYLAPLILERIKANPKLQTGGGPTGVRGQPIDPVILDEEKLTKKEIDQGPSYFNLQHMLSTKLSDQDRFPLKVGLVRWFDFNREEMLAPMSLAHIRTAENVIKWPEGHTLKDKMYRVQSADDYGTIASWFMYIDPAGGGQNGDETAYAITGLLGGRVFVAASGGVKGGVTEEAIAEIVQIILHWLPSMIGIERNFGNGALAQVLIPAIQRAYDKKLKEEPTFFKGKSHAAPGIEEVWETGQKELRIIDILEPVISSGKLVLHDSIIDDDWRACFKYPGDIRQTYSLLFQMARITRDKKSMIHDDRLDALAGAVRHWVEALGVDDMKAKLAVQRDNYNRMMANPTGEGRPMPGFPGMNKFGASANALAKHGLRAENHLRR